MSELMETWEGEIDTEEDFTDLSCSVYGELSELSCGRTPFQLVHFVVGAHGTIEEGAGPAMRLSALTELNNDLNVVERDKIRLERCKRKRKLLMASDDPDADLDIMECNIEIKETELHMRRRLYEIKVLRAILDKLPKYTWKEMQELEPKRWTHRLLRQSEEYHQALKSGLPQGEVMSMAQAQNDEILLGVGKMTKDLVDDRIKLREKMARIAAEAKLLI